MTEVEDGLVIYDPARNRVHYLNVSAAVVFTFCDGARDRQAIVEATIQIFGHDVISVHEVEGCLAQLENERLLQADS